MKIEIGKYLNYFGPYQLAEKLLFWVPKEKDEFGFSRTSDRVHEFGELLAHGSVTPDPKIGDIYTINDRPTTILASFLDWIHSKRKRKIKVRIDPWDTWSMDDTLGYIILPMLKQLKETQHGVAMVDLEDVPEHMRSDTHNDYDDQKCFDFYFEDADKHEKKEGIYNNEDRWNWILDEMIFAFECKVGKYENWDDQFYSGTNKITFKQLEGGMSEMIQNGDRQYDIDGHNKFHDRIKNGFLLFGKYYEALWD